MRALIQLLYRRGWEKQHIINLFVVLDWMMRLPEHFTQQLWQTIDLIEEQEQMRYVTSIERFANKKGLQQGEAAALQRLLAKRFGTIPAEVSSRISTASLEELERRLAIEATRFDDVFGTGTH
ncbi:DUF4351 domain-containing protein [Candidatus Accumulibacter contiguus]|jgi:hypothetical protein|uniref:DUF4351 domain-containing protein n=1 Tax=Candidatus Accumulibacter contiguus TaxID=2954381 RepID=UPI000451725B